MKNVWKIFKIRNFVLMFVFFELEVEVSKFNLNSYQWTKNFCCTLNILRQGYVHLRKKFKSPCFLRKRFIFKEEEEKKEKGREGYDKKYSFFKLEWLESQEMFGKYLKLAQDLTRCTKKD